MRGPEKCDARLITGFVVAISCTRDDGHDGPHRSWTGQEWGDDE